MRINQQIRADQVRVLSEDKEMLGVMSVSEALNRAKESELDLVEISPNAKPPVVRIVDWGKYRYEKEKQAKQNQKNQKQQELKQIRLSLKISPHDLDIKIGQAKKFLTKGHKVKLTVRLKGREMHHSYLGKEVLEKSLEILADSAKADSTVRKSGREFSITVSPVKK